MAHRAVDDQQNQTASESPRVTVRYWAAARAAAGVDEETIFGRNVAEVLTAAVRAHDGDLRFERVLRLSSILVGEAPVGTRELETVVVESGDVLEILPPFAGG
ncbi:MAG: MoaD/ThiS family protein [Nocardioidaceae bacterium]|nr:MoaD/ThiS family protein [Nocardioidaceae bacterium]